ncbi:copper chaperone [Streptomyces sp. ms191]|uniref:cation transporter n=1 Tax=unclassified Streptomyces TaxID=2593676 RepID=UPI0011CE9989|nr:cation transporter [Streptomyces sp. ms191]TXS30269.1 copper chaperone [Streptomyces sp. ms191]
MSRRTPDADRPTATTATTTAYAVTGMSCGHCRTAVTDAVGALDGVTSVDVDVPGGLVTVTTGGAPDDTAIAAAIDDAGYTLTGRA